MDTFNATLTPAIRASFESSMLGAERATRIAAERRAAAYAQFVVNLIEAIAPGLLEKHAADGIERWAPEQWEAHLDDILEMTQARFSQQHELIQSFQAKQASAERQYQSVYNALQSAVREIEQLRQSQMSAAMGKGPGPSPARSAAGAVQPSLLQAAPISIPEMRHMPHLPAGLHIDVPEAMPSGWGFSDQQEYRRKAFFIGLIGKTGRCSNRWLSDVAAVYCGVKDGEVGTIKRLVKSAVSNGWIEVVKSKTKWLAGLPDLIRLTPRGEELYRTIYGSDPVESDLTRLLREHAPHGTDHAVLCVMAALAFEQLGGKVHLAPGPISIGSGIYQPDLRVEIGEDEVVWLVECEQANGSPEGRRRKWENAIGLQGKVCIITPTAEVRDRLVDEVLALGRRCEVYASDIKSLQAARPERVWCVSRENNQGVILPTAG